MTTKPPPPNVWMSVGVDLAEAQIIILSFSQDGHDQAVHVAHQRAQKEQPDHTLEIEAFAIAGPDALTLAPTLAKWLTSLKIIGNDQIKALRDIADAVQEMLDTPKNKRKRRTRPNQRRS